MILAVFNRHWNETISNNFFFSFYFCLMCISTFSCYTSIVLIGTGHWTKWFFPPLNTCVSILVIVGINLFAAIVYDESIKFVEDLKTRADHRNKLQRKHLTSLKTFGANLGFGLSVIQKRYLLNFIYIASNITITLLVSIPKSSFES